MRKLLPWIALVGALSPTAFAQNAFVVREDGALRQVKQVHEMRPLIEVNGQLRGTSSHEFTFLKATLYRPGLVTLSDFEVKTRHIEDSTGGRYNYNMEIYGHAKSDTPFKNCYLALELTAWKSSNVAFMEIPDLPAGRNVEINVSFPMAERLEEGTYHVHLFADGIEVLHSKMSASYLAAQKKKTEALLLRKVTDYPAILAHRTRPTYPASLKPANVAGAARVRATIARNGDVTAPELINATLPAFGRAALETVVKWKFDPALKDRKIVESTVEIPVVFEPPK